MAESRPFWRTKSLAEMADAEWESLCDGCGRSCPYKLRDEATGALAFTNVPCRFLDSKTCRRTDYGHRRRRVRDRVRLTPDNLAAIDWLPPSRAYRRLAEGLDLPSWHPLVTGDPASVHRARASVARRVVSETKGAALEDHVVTWPAAMPRRHSAKVANCKRSRPTCPASVKQETLSSTLRARLSAGAIQSAPAVKREPR